MKKLLLLIAILGLELLSTSHSGFVFASRAPNVYTLDQTPIPTPLEATATVNPDSIGDTSGVIAIGMLVVIIILAGVVWGTLELRQESLKNKQTKE